MLSLKLYGITKRNKFNIVDADSSNTLKYSPNEHMNVGFGFAYRGFGLNIAVNPHINVDDDQFGTTRKLDCQTNIYWRKFLLDLNYQRYNGYYIENPQYYVTNFNIQGQYPIRPDVQTKSWGGSFVYIFNNRKFSYRAPFLQNEKQLKSAGSMVLGSYFYRNSFTADSSLVPAEWDSLFSPDYRLQSARTLNSGVSFGYTHTFVIWKNFYINLSLMPGLSVFSVDAKNEDGQSVDIETKLSLRNQARFALGYNRRHFFAGISAVSDNFYAAGERSAINFEFGNVRLFVGKRFNFKDANPVKKKI